MKDTRNNDNSEFYRNDTAATSDFGARPIFSIFIPERSYY